MCPILSNFGENHNKNPLDQYYVTSNFHFSVVENSVEVVENRDDSKLLLKIEKVAFFIF